MADQGVIFSKGQRLGGVTTLGIKHKETDWFGLKITQTSNLDLSVINHATFKKRNIVKTSFIVLLGNLEAHALPQISKSLSIIPHNENVMI